MMSSGRLMYTSLQGLKASALRKASFTRTIVTGPVYWRRKAVQLPRRSRISRAAASDKKPTLESASAMPLSFQEMDNSALVTLGAMGYKEARQEILHRHIMVIDRCSYDQAEIVSKEIDQKNEEYLFLLALPYHIGVASALTAGFVSFPMVFHLPSVEWFNHHFVTSDVPEPKDLETMLECGSWAWNWMEPPLGTLSFILLCMQFTRAQIQNLGAKPYTEMIKHWRAERLAKAFPKYDARIVFAYSESSALYK